MRKIHLFILLGIALLLCPLWAYAEEDPLRQARDASQQLVSQSEAFQKQTSQFPQKDPSPPVIQQEEEPEAAEEDKGAEIKVKKYLIEGNTIFSESQLRPLVEKGENKTATLADIKVIVRSVTDYYRAQGYMTSRAYLPPQKIDGGVVKISVIESRVGEVRVEGNKYFSAKSYQKAMGFKDHPVLRFQELEARLTELNQKPDRMAKAFLVAGKEPTTSDILLKVEERLPLHGSYEFNNRGTKLTKLARHNLQLSHNNLLGFNDMLMSSLILAEEGAITGLSIGYSFPFEKTGTAVSLNYSMTRSELMKPLKESKIEGNAFNLTPQITQRLWKTKSFQLMATLGFEIKNSETKVLHERLHFDRMRILKTALMAQHLDTQGKTALDYTANTGIPDIMNGLNRKDDASSIAGTGGAFLYHAINLTRIQKLPYSSIGIFKFGTQLTNDRLPSTEQYRAGGALSVRGYPESDASGDFGYDWSAEINSPVPYLTKRKMIPRTKIPLRDAVRLAVFFDGAQSFLQRRSSFSDQQTKLLLSAGFGFRIQVQEYVQVRLDWGFPFGDDSSDNNRSFIHLSAKSGF